jgi:AcrR family transcriptional regulator
MARVSPALPRGRHGLSREQVASTQRRRIFGAMADVMADKGYARTTVADVIGAAGVSRETFYEQFSSKQHCFEEAFDSAAAELFGGLADQVATTTGEPPSANLPADRFERLLGAYLDAIASQPNLARLCLVEVFAAGPGALERRASTQARFVDATAAIMGLSGRDGRFACEALVAAVSSMVTARLAAGDAEGLRALRAPLGRLVRMWGTTDQMATPSRQP